MPKALKNILFSLVSIGICLVALEGFLFISVRAPLVHKILPDSITKISRRLYFFYDMKVIQFLPQCGRFDSRLGYTLKPGKCIFSNSEFTTAYTINSLGVRDTEEALDSPEIVVLGDSYGMGWGVNQNQTFAKLIEAKTGLKVLNAAVASYGTVREMMLLDKIKRDKLRYLIIQYCENDYGENIDYINHGDRLIAMSQEKYDREVKNHRERMRYYFGKFILGAWDIIKENYRYLFKIGDFKKVKADLYKRPKDEADAFLYVIMTSGIDLSGVQLMVFNASQSSDFVKSLKPKITSPQYPAFIKNMIILDAMEFINDKHRFVLDGHFNRRGHQVLADKLLQHIVYH